jgi:hypothetical protein
VRLITTPGSGGIPAGDNEVLLASDAPLAAQHGSPAFGAVVYEQAALVKLVHGDAPLRDDYAPVDQLETR